MIRGESIVVSKADSVLVGFRVKRGLRYRFFRRSELRGKFEREVRWWICFFRGLMWVLV